MVSIQHWRESSICGEQVGEAKNWLGPLGAGATAGVAASLVRVPTEVVKQRLQLGGWGPCPHSLIVDPRKERYPILPFRRTLHRVATRLGHHGAMLRVGDRFSWRN